jgi:hypothetical protein
MKIHSIKSKQNKQKQKQQQQQQKLVKRTLETLESSFALRAELVSFFTLILITSSANWKGTLVASHEKLSVSS